MQKINLNSKETHFGNFIPVSLIQTGIIAAIICAVLTFLSLIVLKIKSVALIFFLLMLVYFAFSVYSEFCRIAFSFKKGDCMGKFHQFLVDHFMWDGKGTCLDIGCGLGALTIRNALTYPDGEFIGIDIWKAGWNYGKDICDANAKYLGVDGRISFLKGNATKLDFSEDTFDAVTSNYLLKDIKSETEKTAIIQEAFRVLKTGGFFAFQDVFGKKTTFGTLEDFIKKLEDDGITEIHYIRNVENEIDIPGFLKTPWVIRNTGLIYGIK